MSLVPESFRADPAHSAVLLVDLQVDFLRDEEPVFTKARSDAFSNAQLESWIHQHAIERLLVLGVYADACVRRTAEGALRRGIAVTVPRVGVASRSTAAVDRGLRAIRRAGGTTQ